MCNLYNLTTNQQAIRDLARVMTDSLGNLGPSLDVYPDRLAPVVRNTANGRELARLTWGMPTPPQHGHPGDPRGRLQHHSYQARRL